MLVNKTKIVAQLSDASEIISRSWLHTQINTFLAGNCIFGQEIQSYVYQYYEL